MIFRSIFRSRMNERWVSKLETDRLKLRIMTRLLTEDYTCRLPKVPKPRIRYKIRLKYRKVAGGVTVMEYYQ